MKALTPNMCALIFCALGSPSPDYHGDDVWNPVNRVYPTVDESIRYMMKGGPVPVLRETPQMKIEDEESREAQVEQLSLFG